MVNFGVCGILQDAHHDGTMPWAGLDDGISRNEQKWAGVQKVEVSEKDGHGRGKVVSMDVGMFGRHVKYTVYHFAALPPAASGTTADENRVTLAEMRT